MKPRFRSLSARVAPLLGLTVFCSFQSLQAASGVWTGTTSGGNWSDTANWSGGTVADGSANLANFTTLDLPAGAFTVNLDSARTIGSLSFNDTDGATAGTWTVSGANTLTLDGTPMITTGVNATIASVVAGTSGFGKSGSANLILTNANTISGTISVSTGQLTTKNNAALGTSTLALANAAIYRIERTTGNAFTFVGNAISVGSGATAIITSDNAGNGYSGAISGASNASFQIGNTGALTQVSLSANNNVRQFENFLGTVEILDGASVRFSASNTLNNGGLDATFDTNTSGTITTRNNGTMNLGALVGNGTVTMGTSGSNNNWVTYNIGAKGTDTTYGGRILDGDTANGKRVAINKVGAGSLKLTHATDITYTGTTNVNEGSLIVNGAKSGTGANNININGTLAGSGSLAGTTTVANGGTLEPGDAGAGNLTLANATFATGSTIKLGATPSTNKVVIGTGSTLTLNSGISVDVNGFNTDGTYQIITTTGATVSGSPSASLTAINTDPLKVYSFSNDANGIYLTIGASDPNNYWKPDSGGTWGAAGNWTKNVVPNAAEASAKIGPGPEGLGGSFTPLFPEITLDAVRTVGEVVINDDFGAKFTIAPGTGGSLLMDNGALPASIVLAKGSHAISAPIAVDPEDLSFDIAENLDLDVSGVISSQSTGGGVIKTGLGILKLTGTNTFDGGLALNAGTLDINGDAAMGNAANVPLFNGGTLRLTANLANSRNMQVAGANNARIDTNGFNHTYSGVISPSGGGTGGILKVGAGTLSLSAVQTYTGNTAVSGGLLSMLPGSSVTTGAVVASAGGNFELNGGTFTATAGSSLTNGSDIIVNSGTATFTSVGTPTNTGDACLIGVNGGTFSASSVTIHRNYNAGATLPTAAPTGSGFVVTNGTAIVSGGVALGISNSSGSGLVSGGSLTVGGQITLGNHASAGRYSVFQVTGGTFTSTDATNGVVLSTHNATANSAALLINGGTSTIERIGFGDGDSIAGSIGALVLDGPSAALYMGTGGIDLASPNAFNVTVNLGQGLLGAKSAWDSTVPMTLLGGTTIKAADAADAPFDITLGGVLSGAGGFTKTGTGTLTLSGANTYAGTTDVTAGTLVIAGDQSAATGDVLTAAGTTLGGNGNIGGNVTIASTATHRLAVGATPGSQVTRVISGDLNLNPNNILDLTAAGPVAGGTYILATATGGINGALGTVNLPGGVSGNVVINGSNIELTVVVSGYNTWASTNANNQAADLDFDSDGVSNGVEYFMNAPAGFTANPGLVSGTVTWTNGGNISHTAYGTQFVVQTSNNLSSWTDVLAGNPNLNNTAGSVSFTPTGPAPLFVRLKVTPN